MIHYNAMSKMFIQLLSQFLTWCSRRNDFFDRSSFTSCNIDIICDKGTGLNIGSNWKNSMTGRTKHQHWLSELYVITLLAVICFVGGWYYANFKIAFTERVWKHGQRIDTVSIWKISNYQFLCKTLLKNFKNNSV